MNSLEDNMKRAAIIAGGVLSINLISQKLLKQNLGINVSPENRIKVWGTTAAVIHAIACYRSQTAAGAVEKGLTGLKN